MMSGRELRGKGAGFGHCLPLALLAAGAILTAAAPAGAGATDTKAGWVPSLAATIEAMPKNLPRAEGPALDASITAARKAVAACAAQGAQVSVIVADVLGKPVVLLSGDGAGVRSQLIAQTKANIVAKFHMSSGEVAEQAKADSALAAQAAADPGIGVVRGGGLPVLRDGRLAGIVAVSGAGLGGDLMLDEKCARIAVADLEAR